MLGDVPRTRLGGVDVDKGHKGPCGLSLFGRVSLLEAGHSVSGVLWEHRLGDWNLVVVFFKTDQKQHTCGCPSAR